MIQFQCMACNTKIALTDDYRGKRIRCKQCAGVILVPGMPRAVVEKAVETPAAQAQPAPPSATRAVEPRPHAEPKPEVLPRVPAEQVDPMTWLVDRARIDMAPVVIAVLLILFGAFWLFDALHWIRGVRWLWSIGLAACGLLIFGAGGFNKKTWLIGGYMFILCLFSVIRLTGHISLEVEIPSLVISFGALLLVVTLAGHFAPDILGEDVDAGRPPRSS